VTVLLAELAVLLLVLALLAAIAGAWDRRRVRDSWNRNHVSRRRP
jgi:hypothetical protein